MSSKIIKTTIAKDASYKTKVNPKLMDEMKVKILDIIVMQKKFIDPEYSAIKLSEDLNTNTRYISAVFSVKFHSNYNTFINKYRIEEAMTILKDKRFSHLNVEDVGDMVGFKNRQSFYSAFTKINGITPRQYKLQEQEKQAITSKAKSKND